MADETDDVLRRLEERLERASGAAERLFSVAAEQATSAVLGSQRGGPDAASPPPQGWASAGQDGPRAPGDLELLITTLEAVGELVPPDLRRRLGDAVREILLAVRALIDWYLERRETGSGQAPEVQDIPVL